MHATVAGVLLGLLVPVNREVEDDPDRHSLAERIEHRIRPFSAGFAVPVFAFFAAGVTVVGGGFGAALRDPAAIGVVVGLVVGKTVGVFGGTWAVARFTRAELDEDLSWTDVLGLSVLGGGRASPSACSSASSPSAPARSATTTSSSPSWAAASSPPCSRPSCCECATGTTGSSRPERPRTSDHDGIPDVYESRGTARSGVMVPAAHASGYGTAQ